MPAGLIEDKDGVSAGAHVGADLIEVMLHALGVGALHDDSRAGPAGRADGAEQIGAAGAQIGHLARAGSAPGPDPRALGLLADAHLVLKPDLYGRGEGLTLTDLRHLVGEVFLNASRATSSWR